MAEKFLKAGCTEQELEVLKEGNSKHKMGSPERERWIRVVLEMLARYKTVITVDELASVVGVTPRAIFDWKKKYLPKKQTTTSTIASTTSVSTTDLTQMFQSHQQMQQQIQQQIQQMQQQQLQMQLQIQQQMQQLQMQLQIQQQQQLQVQQEMQQQQLQVQQEMQQQQQALIQYLKDEKEASNQQHRKNELPSDVLAKLIELWMLHERVPRNEDGKNEFSVVEHKVEDITYYYVSLPSLAQCLFLEAGDPLSANQCGYYALYNYQCMELLLELTKPNLCNYLATKQHAEVECVFSKALQLINNRNTFIKVAEQLGAVQLARMVSISEENLDLNIESNHRFLQAIPEGLTELVDNDVLELAQSSTSETWNSLKDILKHPLEHFTPLIVRYPSTDYTEAIQPHYNDAINSLKTDTWSRFIFHYYIGRQHPHYVAAALKKLTPTKRLYLIQDSLQEKDWLPPLKLFTCATFHPGYSMTQKRPNPNMKTTNNNKKKK